jgi:hypothetical protein
MVATIVMVALTAFNFRDAKNKFCHKCTSETEDYHRITCNKNRRTGIRMISILATGILLTTLLPSKNTLIAMLVADKFTYDVAEKVIDTGKDIKDEIKADIIEIFNNIESEETNEDTDTE